MKRCGSNLRSPIKNQFTHSDSASNVDEKWPRNNDDLMHTPTQCFFLKYSLSQDLLTQQAVSCEGEIKEARKPLLYQI